MTLKTHSAQEKLIQEILSIKGDTVYIEKGSYLFREGQSADCMYILKQGKMKISKLSCDGKELGLRLTSGISILCEFMLFADTPVHMFNGQAQESCEIYVVNRKKIEEYAQDHPSFLMSYLKMMCNYIQQKHSKFGDLVLYGKKGALYSTIIRLCNSYGVETKEGIRIDTPITHQELANYSSTTRESVNRSILELKEKGYLDSDGKYLIIKNLEYFKTAINCENCTTRHCNIQ